MQHVMVVFHPGRRAPGTGKNAELIASSRQHFLDKRDTVFQVVGDAETLQLCIAMLDAGAAFAGKIATVDVRAPQRIANTFPRVATGS